MGKDSGWSKVSHFETGLFCHKHHWEAPFFSPVGENDKSESKGWFLKKEITINKHIKSARAYATALGIYNLQINSQKVGKQELTPG